MAQMRHAGGRRSGGLHSSCTAFRGARGAEPTPAERAFSAVAAEFPEAVAGGSYIGLPLDKPAVTERFQGLEGLLGPEDALYIVENDVRVLLFDKDYVGRAWELLKEKEKPGGCTALSVVRKNPGLLTCEAYGLGGETLESLDRTASVIDSLRAVGLGPGYFFVVATIGFVFILVAGRLVTKALAPVLDPVLAPVLDVLQTIPKPLSVVNGLLGFGSPGT